MRRPLQTGTPLLTAKILDAGLLLVTPLVFYRGFSLQFTTPKIILTKVIVLAALGLLALRTVWGKRPWLVEPHAAWPLTFLAGTVLLSSVNSQAPDFSFAATAAFLCGPAWLLLQYAQGEGESGIRRQSSLIAIAGGIAGLISVLQWAGHDPLLFGGYHIDLGSTNPAMFLYSTLGNPNIAAGYFIGAIFPAAAISLAGRNAGERILGGLAAVLMAVAIAGSRSRGAWLGLAAGITAASILWSSPLDRTKRRRRLVALVVILVAALSGAILLVGFNTTINGRLFLWRAAWPMFPAHFLSGSGWGSFAMKFPALQAQFLALHPEYTPFWTFTDQLHNDLLQLLFEAGALGLAAFCWLLWQYCRELRNANKTEARSRRLWCAASAGGVTAILACSFFNFQFAVPPTLILLFTLIAVPYLLRPHREFRYFEPGPIVPAIATAFIMVICGYLFLQIFHTALADHELAQGIVHEDANDIDLAEHRFRAGLLHAPRDGPLEYGLARALYLEGRYPEALGEVTQAERTVSDSHLEVLKARIQEQMGDRRAALSEYKHALWLNPGLASVRANIEHLENNR